MPEPMACYPVAVDGVNYSEGLAFFVSPEGSPCRASHPEVVSSNEAPLPGRETAQPGRLSHLPGGLGNYTGSNAHRSRVGACGRLPEPPSKGRVDAPLCDGHAHSRRSSFWRNRPRPTYRGRVRHAEEVRRELVGPSLERWLLTAPGRGGDGRHRDAGSHQGQRHLEPSGNTPHRRLAVHRGRGSNRSAGRRSCRALVQRSGARA